MALGILAGTVIHSNERPLMEITLKNLYPEKINGTVSNPRWPLMFVTVACGAMVAEGIIALIWAAGAIAFFWNREGEGTGLTSLKILGGGNSLSVYEMYVSLLGKTGGIIAILGVIICPITSGDTAFRSARMTIFDCLKADEKKLSLRLFITVPLLLTGYVILWTGAVYLSTNYGKEKNRCWIAVIPAVFMSAVCITYLLYAPECFNLGQKSL